MNQITSEIIEEILLDERAWDKKTRELKYDWVIDAYRGEREYRFEEEVLMPRLKRAHRLLATWCNETLNAEGWLEDGNLSDAISEQFSAEWGVGYGISPGLRERVYYRWCYFEALWQSRLWEYEEPTKEEILALEIKPNLVPSKPGQPALF